MACGGRLLVCPPGIDSEPSAIRLKRKEIFRSHVPYIHFIAVTVDEVTAHSVNVLRIHAFYPGPRQLEHHDVETNGIDNLFDLPCRFRILAHELRRLEKDDR